MSITDADLGLAQGGPAVEAWAEIRGATRRVLKRTIDVVVAVLGLLVALPLVAVLAVLIRRDGGPVLFRQRRLGRDGEVFGMYKFRSMAVDAEERLRSDPELYAQYLANDFKLPAERDPRITRLGRFLRASSLDEIPQLVNVLRGEMSLVGPRPIVEAELAEYRARGGEQAYLGARPGMTGLWQVSGRSLVGYDQRVEMDVRYAAQPGVRTDLAIMVRTFGAVVRREGAH